MSRIPFFKIVLGLYAPLLFAPGLLGQGRVSIDTVRQGPASPGMSQHRRPGFGISIGGGRREQFRRGLFFYPYGVPYYSDSGEYYESEPRSPLATLPPAPAPELKSGPLPDPVLLELRGNQWVRVTSFGAQAEAGSASAAAAQTQSKLQRESAPALLVYRDGHTEEVSSYSIIGQTMYTKSDYWSSGSWIRTIQMADLDVPATLKQNQERGVKFELPSGPDEVMIRP